ncbi:unnamed protein product, partial [marine sediment metagenome]
RERDIVALTETEKDTCDVVQTIRRYLERRK